MCDGAFGLEQLAEEPHRGKAVTLWLDENTDDDAVLVDRSPQIMLDAIDFQEDFVQMPLVAGPGAAFPQACRVQVSELLAPAPDRFVADQHAGGKP